MNEQKLTVLVVVLFILK